jgi:hypothetical protein
MAAVSHVSAFAPHPLSSRIQKQYQREQGTSPFVTTSITSSTSSTQLQERQWNFNEGQGPFGLKKNAEIWNGRVAQVSDETRDKCSSFSVLHCIALHYTTYSLGHCTYM